MANSQIKEVFDAQFKFEIGEHAVIARDMQKMRDEAAVNGGSLTVRRFERLGSPNFVTIVGRMAEECEGGVQKHYRIRAYNREGEFLVTYAQEFELLPHEQALEEYRGLVELRDRE